MFLITLMGTDYMEKILVIGYLVNVGKIVFNFSLFVCEIWDVLI